MKTTNIIIALIILLFAVSCKTTQKTSSTLKTESELDLSFKSTNRSDSSGVEKKDIQVHDNTVIDEDIETITTETQWSEPDSLGKQFPLKTKTTATNRTKKTKNDFAITDKTMQKSNLQKENESQLELEAKKETDSKNINKTTVDNSSGIKWLLIAVGIGIAFTIYFFISKR